MKKLFQRRKGFTLIELLIVIVIIGILAVGFAPTLLNAPKKARDGVRKGQIASIQQAIEAYALDKNSTYPATQDGCIGEGGTVDPDISTYFQGGVVASDKSSIDTVCKGFGYYNDSGATPPAYYISVLLENGTTLGPIAGTSGNSAKPASGKPTDAEIADGKGPYYVVKVKY